MPANDKSDWQIEKNKQKITTTKHGHRCSRLASGKVRFLGHKSYSYSLYSNTKIVLMKMIKLIFGQKN